jgi:hypothetical protein
MVLGSVKSSVDGFPCEKSVDEVKESIVELITLKNEMS